MLRIIVSTLLVCTIFSGCLAAPLTGSEDQEPFSLLVSVSLSLASFLCLVLAVVGCACCCGKTSILKYEESVEYDERHNTNQSHTNDAFADFSPPTQSTPSFPPGGVSETVSIEALPDLSSRLQTSHGLPQVSTALNDTGQQDGDLKHLKSPRFVFPRDQLNYVDELGNGWFGKVLQGEAHRLHPGMRKTRVVIKQLRDTASPEEQLLFLQEVQPYREVNHPNVLMLLGQCIESIPLLLVLEYAPYGDLKNYLRKNRGMVAEMAQKDVQLRMAHDIISGLLWLHQADFVHIDLAARNCQVCSDTSVKIGDYGLALEKYPEDYYITKDECHAVPIRWLGPEVIEIRGQDIKPKKITKQSNIWSFGVIMLELSTAADRPYPNLSDEQVLKQVVMDQDIKLDKPKLDLKYADRWFEIMMFCWMDGDTRPTVKEVHELLTHLKKNVDRVQMEDFETKWNALKPAVANQSSSECSEASQETPQQDLSVEIGRGDPLSIGMPKGDPLSSVSDVSQKQAQQTVSVDVTVPSLGQTGQEDQLIEDLAKGAKKSQPFEVTFDEPEEPAPRNVQETETVSELIPSIATPQANTAPPAGGNMSHELSFEDAFDTPTPTPQGDKQSSSQSFGLDDSVQNADVTPKTPDFFSSEDVNPVEASTPFPPTQEPNMQVSIDTSLSTGGYDTAVSNLLEANDSTVTFTESFNTMSSNPFSSGTSSSEPGGFVSAVESAGDKSLEDSQDYGNNGFGEFESSMLSYGTPSEGGMSSVLETPTPGGWDKGSSDLFGDLSQPSNPFDSSSASVSFGVNVDSPAVKDISFEQMAQNGEEKKDLQSFGAIRLTEHEKDSTDTPPVAEHDMTPQGYAEVSTAAKKPFSMTMLTVTSGKKKKSIEIHKEDDEDEDGKDAGDAASRVTVMTNGSSKMAKDEVVSSAAPPDSSAGTNLLDFDISGSGLDQGPGLAPGLTAGFGTIELQVSKDGEEAVVVPPQSPESLVEFGSFEDVSKES